MREAPDREKDPHLYYAWLLRCKLNDEERDRQNFIDKLAEGSPEFTRTMTWGPHVDAAIETATRIEEYSRFIAALEHTPDPENPVPADEETPEQRVTRVREFIEREILRKARHVSRGSSPSGVYADRCRLATLADVAEILGGLMY